MFPLFNQIALIIMLDCNNRHICSLKKYPTQNNYFPKVTRACFPAIRISYQIYKRSLEIKLLRIMVTISGSKKVFTKRKETNDNYIHYNSDIRHLKLRGHPFTIENCYTLAPSSTTMSYPFN